MEQVVVLIKPDGVRRGLTGEVIRRFENAQLKVIALKMIWAKEDLLGRHYTDKKEYLVSLGEKTLKSYTQFGKDPGEDLGTKDPYELGKMVRSWALEGMSSGPIVALLLAGRHAVDKARTIAGPTMPVDAPPGTIRGDFASDSAAYANYEKRIVWNVIHVSGSPKEAEFERELWFKEEEINNYKRTDMEE